MVHLLTNSIKQYNMQSEKDIYEQPSLPVEGETQDELWEDVENISIFNDNPKILLATKIYITRKP